MKRFEFDPYETLRRVRAEIEDRKCQRAGEVPTLPFPPFSPFPVENDGLKNGRNGKTGTTTDQSEKIADALDHFEERSAMREYDGCQPRSEAEQDTMIEAARAAGIEVIDLRAAIDARRKRKTWER